MPHSKSELSAEPARWARPEKLAQTLALHIRKQLVTGDLANGHVFPSEPVLVDQYKVSRTTLREAFRILESQSLVEIQRGARGGARATIPDILVAARQLGMHLQLQGATLSSVYQTRTTLEVPMARELALRQDPRHIEQLRDALAEERRTLGNTDEFRDASTSFHKLIGECSANTSQIVANMLGVLVNLHAQQVVHESVPNEEAAVHRAHAKLLKLVERGEDAAAEEGVYRVAVVGRPHDVFGEVPVAFVVTNPGATLSSATIEAFVARQALPYKRVYEVIFVPELPVSRARKVFKRELRQQLVHQDANG